MVRVLLEAMADLGGAFSGSTNPLYGVATNPNDVGSGGGGFNGSPAGNGGGLARIAAQTFVLNGAVRAGGGLAEGNSAGGSGGGIRIDVGTLSGTGVIGANGSSGTPSGGGGGGGGRVAVYYGSATGFNLSNITVNGGIGSGAPNGQSGTIHLQQQIAKLSPKFGDAMPVMTAQGSLRGVRRPVSPAVSGMEQANASLSSEIPLSAGLRCTQLLPIQICSNGKCLPLTPSRFRNRRRIDSTLIFI